MAPAAPVVERLPLFADMMAAARNAGRCIVRDFAPASPDGIALFNSLPCRVEIADLPDALPGLQKLRDETAFTARIRELLPLRPAHPASIVLCWDLLNYFPRGAISKLMDHVADLCQPGARVHALIAYSSPEMPARPARYLLAGTDSVRVSPDADTTRESPRYAPNDLMRCLPRFEMDHAMMLRNGYQEYCLRRIG